MWPASCLQRTSKDRMLCNYYLATDVAGKTA
jgi:hypothetical protein